MNAITVFNQKWNPFKEMEEMQNRLSHYLGNGSLTRKSEEEPAATELWTPLVDVSEDDKEYLIKVELPEIKKSDIAVKVEKGVLSITGERKFQKEEKGKKDDDVVDADFEEVKDENKEKSA